MTTNFPASLDNFTNPNNTDTLNSPSHSAQHADVNDAVEALQAKVGADSSAVTTSLDYKVSQLETNSVTLSGSETLTNKTLTAPVVNNAILQGAEESWNVLETFAMGSLTLDTLTSTAWYYSWSAQDNWTLNIRGDGSTTLSSILNVGDSITVAVAVQQGGGSYATALSIDGVSVTPKWQGGSAPSSGGTDVDVYVYTIIKTAATPTYTVLASQTQFA